MEVYYWFLAPFSINCAPLYVTFSLSKEIAGFVPIFTSTKIVVSLSDTSPQNKIAILQDGMECTKAVRVYHALGMMYLTM